MSHPKLLAFFRILGVLFLWTAVGSCRGVAECEGQYSVSPDFYPWEREIIGKSALEVNAFTGKQSIRLTPAGDPSACGINRINTAEQYEQLRNRKNPPHPEFHGIQLDDTGTIWVIPYRNDFRITMLHEMGHALGFKHISGRGIMTDPVTSEVFTLDDQRECAARGVCSAVP